MRFNFTTHKHGLNLNTGFGYAGYNVVRSLQALGHQVGFDDPSAEVQLFFSHPENFKWLPNQYRIGYVPWESSELKPGWLEKMNECDEIWTPSDLVAEWFKDTGVSPPIYVYEHGVENIWLPHKREGNDRLRFLHHGAEANRKCGQLTFDAFMDVFGPKNEDVILTFKANGPIPVRGKYPDGTICNVKKFASNVKIISNEMSLDNLVGLYYMNDVMIYPSMGEGFGLAPLQAMATGMPVIINPRWATYRKYALEELSIGDKMIDSPFLVEHPGKVLEPDYDELCMSMQTAFDNFSDLSNKAYDRAEDIHDEYNWIEQTEKSFQHIFDKFDQKKI